MRISREQMYMEIARTVSKRSTCHRLNVGAVITADNRLVSTGYNGSPPGEAHCAGDNCTLSSTGGCIRAKHAEWNALHYLPLEYREGAHAEELVIYCTHSPCPNCAAHLLYANIRKIIYEIPYRDTSAVDWLILNGAEVLRYSPSGYIFSHNTNKIERLI